MAAAVADYRPAAAAGGQARARRRRGRSSSSRPPTCSPPSPRGARPGQVLVGFAAEAGADVARAEAKRVRKGVDLIVLNDVSRSRHRLRRRAQRGRARRRADGRPTHRCEIAARPKRAIAGARCSTPSSTPALRDTDGVHVRGLTPDVQPDPPPCPEAGPAAPPRTMGGWRPHLPSSGARERPRGRAARDRERPARRERRGRARSSAPSWRCWPRATCSSRTSRASARRRWRGRSRARSTAPSRACSSRPTCCRATSRASACSTSAAGEFEFRPGPVFANVVLADELNRASPRTQSALLECMQERQVTVDGVARPLAAPFFVIATQNPIEQDGTFPLPEAQLDRFALRLALGYPQPGRRGAACWPTRRPRAARRSRRSRPSPTPARWSRPCTPAARVHVAPVAARLRRRALRSDARGRPPGARGEPARRRDARAARAGARARPGARPRAAGRRQGARAATRSRTACCPPRARRPTSPSVVDELLARVPVPL